MASTYTDRIRRYCDSHGITVVSVGFGRRSASRFAVVRLDRQPPNLIAATWLTHADVIHFLSRIFAAETAQAPDALQVRVLDFKEYAELVFSGGSRLRRVGNFEPPF